MVYLKTSINYIKIITTSILLFLSGLSLLACGTSPEIKATLEPSPTPIEVPDFLTYVYPTPQSILVQENISSISQHTWAIIRLTDITNSDEPSNLAEMTKQINFLVDGSSLNVTLKMAGHNDQIKIIGRWSFEVGEHEATIKVQKPSGEKLEYSWTFTVVEEEPSLPNMPWGLQFVRPLPNSTISLNEYNELPLVPPYHAPRLADLESNVCIGVHPDKIIEPGEFFETDVSRKYHFLSFDGRSPGEKDLIWTSSEPYEVKVRDDETGEVIASYVGPHTATCWDINPEIGRHQVEIWLRNSLGQEIRYTWSFTITK